MVREIERPEPPYAQIVAFIRDQICRGELKPGDMVPSARRITEEWGVSLATATKVLAALRSEGLVEARPGRGTVVRPHPPEGTTPRDRALSARRTGLIYRPDEHAEILAAEVVPAPASVADAFGFEVGSPVIRRQRVTYREGMPTSASTSWFAGEYAETAPALLSTERLRQGTWRYLEEVTGRVVVTSRDQFSAGEADEQDSALLQIAVGAPVLRGRNWYLDATGAVLEYGESVARANRWVTYEYEIVSQG